MHRLNLIIGSARDQGTLPPAIMRLMAANQAGAENEHQS
jgi:hypothetical protein